MDFSNERYVRVYTRDTTTWKLLDWRARTVLLFLLRKVDRSGLLDVGADGIEGLAATLELPLDLVELGIPQLVTRAVVVKAADAFVLPKFLEAQEAAQSDKLRAKESRARRRAEALGVTIRDTHVTNRDANGLPRDETSLQPDQPSRPAFQARSEKEERSLSLPPTPVALKAPAGGRAAAEIQKRIEAGELTSTDVSRAVASFWDHVAEKGKELDAKQSDAALARWIRRERPAKRPPAAKSPAIQDEDEDEEQTVNGGPRLWPFVEELKRRCSYFDELELFVVAYRDEPEIWHQYQLDGVALPATRRPPQPLALWALVEIDGERYKPYVYFVESAAQLSHRRKVREQRAGIAANGARDA